MLITRAQIAGMIPHAGTMQLLDGVLSWDATGIRAEVEGIIAGEPLVVLDYVSLVDEGTFEEHDAGVKSADPLKFVDSAAYTDRIKRYEKESGLPEAVICGTGKINGIAVSLAVMDFRFCGGAMGAAVGGASARRKLATNCAASSGWPLDQRRSARRRKRQVNPSSERVQDSAAPGITAPAASSVTRPS